MSVASSERSAQQNTAAIVEIGAMTSKSGRTLLAATVCGLLLVAANSRAAEEVANEVAETSDETAANQGETIRLADAADSRGGGPLERVVVVRSRNKEESAQDVPLSISVISGEELEALHAVDLSSITRRAANISWNTGNSRTSSISIRGVGKQAQTDAQDPSVGIVVDGVPYAYNPLASFDFTDVESVEVTRGPQGTLFGKNANLGLVNITTRRPTFENTVDYSLGFGERNRFIGKAAGGGALVDDLLAWRGAFSVDRGDGYITNAYNPDHTYNNNDRISGRAQLLLTPADNFSARLSVDLQPRISEFYNGLKLNTPTPAYYANGAPNTSSSDPSVRLARRWFTQDSDFTYQANYLNLNGNDSLNLDNQAPLVTQSRGTSLTLDWRLGSYDLISISAYRDYHFQARNDEGTPFDISKNGGGMVDKYQQLSQEFRVSSQLGQLADYQVGVYGVHSQLVKGNRVGWGSDAGAWFATDGQYRTLDADANGRQLLVNSLNRLDKDQEQHIDNKSGALFAQADWKLGSPFTLTTGARITREDRGNPGNSLLTGNGFGGELNPVAVNGVQLGGFASAANGTLLAGNSIEQLGLADKVASKYFGVAATATPGEAYQSLTPAQRAQVGAAKTLRQTQLGVLWNDAEPEPFEQTQASFVVSQSYNINQNLNTYISWQFGEKAGISQLTNGLSTLARPETSTAYEWGLKSVLFDQSLILNFAVFLNEIEDYQQAVQVYDGYTTQLRNDGTLYYVGATGNAEQVRVKGVEIDGAYNGIENLSLHFAAAYNDAVYEKFSNAAQPPENANQSSPYRDLSGESLPGASKYAFNLGGEYRVPVSSDKDVFANFNTSYTSKNNSDVTLSSYGWVGATTLTDLAIGFGRRDRTLQANVLVKNLFNDDTPLARTWNSYIPSAPRWIGVEVSGKLL